MSPTLWPTDDAPGSDLAAPGTERRSSNRSGFATDPDDRVSRDLDEADERAAGHETGDVADGTEETPDPRDEDADDEDDDEDEDEDDEVEDEEADEGGVEASEPSDEATRGMVIADDEDESERKR